MPKIMTRRHTKFNNRIWDGGNSAGVHAPHINLTYVDNDVHIQLKKVIQSGEERTLILKPEQFFDISKKSDEIKHVGQEIANYHGRNSATQPANEFGSFKFISRSDFDSHKYERMYEWEVPNSKLRVSVRNRRSDGKKPKDAVFVVEVRVFSTNGLPTDEGIMMAWHNFHGTFVHHRRERQNRIEEMRRNGVLNPSAISNISNDSRSTHDATNTVTASLSSAPTANLPTWTIQEKFVNDEAYLCVICMDVYVKDEKVNGLPHCSHYFHSKCIGAWLVGSNCCPVCRSNI